MVKAETLGECLGWGVAGRPGQQQRWQRRWHQRGRRRQHGDRRVLINGHLIILSLFIRSAACCFGVAKGTPAPASKTPPK